MPYARFIGKSLMSVTTAIGLASCGIRLPDTPAVTYREPTKSSAAGVKSEKPDVLIWLIADGIHTGMVFPYDWLLESGFIPPKDFGSPKFVTLSWGDRTSYVEKGLHTPVKFFQALFMPTPSVMELIPANYYVAEVCPNQRIWRKLLPYGRGRDVAAFLNDCSIRGQDGRPIVCGTSSWGGGVLLESRHIYFVPRVCNVWTAQIIDAMGGKINPWLAMTANGLIRQAEKPPNDFEQIWWGGGLSPNRSNRPNSSSQP